jgi:hypothetical protein
MIEFTVTLGVGSQATNFTVREAVNDPDRQRQTQRFCSQTYSAGYTNEDVWYPPHLILAIRWKEVEE